MGATRATTGDLGASDQVAGREVAAILAILQRGAHPGELEAFDERRVERVAAVLDRWRAAASDDGEHAAAGEEPG